MSYLPFLQGNEEAVLAAKNLQDQLTNIFVQFDAVVLQMQDNSTVYNYDCCERYLNINEQIPYWVLVEKADRGGTELTIFDFVQKYYDWLYCDNNCGGSDYLLENKLLDVIDVEKTAERFYRQLFYTYFPEYRSDEVLINADGLIVTNSTIGSFVKGIKTRFYVKKGSLESIKIFFNKIFNLTTPPIIRYPKKQILRLNAGAFYNPNFNFSSGTIQQVPEPTSIANEIIGSALNHNRLQDGEVFTDYSYIISTNLSSQSYRNLYKRTIHPAGLNCIFELDLTEYEPPGSTYVEDFTLCETTTISRYSPYRLNTTYVNATYALANINGTTFYGITYGNGCTLGGTFGSTAAYFFPNWASTTNFYTKFLDIPMNEMFKLCRINTSTNPNLTIPSTC